MKIVSNRREFLTQLSLVVVLSKGFKALGIQKATSTVGANLGSGQLQVLAAAMDEIIPRRDGMPSATDAGGLEYLQYLGWQYSGIEEEIVTFLDTMRHETSARFGMEFLSLQHELRVQLLADMERNHAPAFAAFIGYVYEAYYTRPIVQGAFSCPRSSSVAEDLEALLAPVRNMKRLYREVP
jgi:hypothetical protein